MKVTSLFILLAAGLTLNSKEVNSHEKIAGGVEASKGQFPWLVSVQVTNFQDGWHICGGTLITPDWVLTAAHCLDSEQPEWLWVVSGEHNRSLSEGTEQFLLVDSFVQHPDYIYWLRPYVNDVGLIHLATPARLDNFTQVLPLPPLDVFSYSPCTESGWGVEMEGAVGTDVVMYTTIDLLGFEVCAASYSIMNDSNAMCAGDINGGVGFCSGDNGGSLICNDDGGASLFSGILSWREGCAEMNKPGIYMNVSKYVTWILSAIQA